MPPVVRDVRGNVESPAARPAIIPVLRHAAGPIAVEEVTHVCAVILKGGQAIEPEPCFIVAAIARACTEKVIPAPVRRRGRLAPPGRRRIIAMVAVEIETVGRRMIEYAIEDEAHAAPLGLFD